MRTFVRSPLALFGWSVLVGVCAIGAYVLVGRGDLLNARADQAESGTARVSQPARRAARYNVTLSAKSASLVRGRDGVTRLVLTGVDPLVEMADVSPGNERYAIATWIWANEWRSLYRTFQPNTTIVWTEKGARRAITVALASGVAKGSTLRFAVRRLALGTRRPLPITAPVIPQKRKRLGRVDVFVDPATTGPTTPAGIVQQGLQTLDGATTTKSPWTVTGSPSSPASISPSSNELRLYSSLANPSGGAFTLEIKQPVGFGLSDLPGNAITIAPTGPSAGGYFRDLNLAGGSLQVGSFSGPAYGMVFDGLDLTGGSLNLAAYTQSPTSTVFNDADFTQATITVRSMPGTIFANSTISGTTFTGNGDGYEATGATFLGTSFDGGFTTNGLTFDGATFSSYSQLNASGGTTTVPTTFNNTTLNSSVVFGSTLTTGASLLGVEFNGTSIQGASFLGTTISNCQFNGSAIGTTTQSVNFNNAQVDGATFQKTIIGAASFVSATLVGADFSLASFAGGPGAISYANADLGQGTVFTSGSGIENANFTGATMDGVQFATGGGAGSSPTFIASMLNSIESTSNNGVVITNATTGETTRFVKQNGVLYQTSGYGTAQAQWQPITIAADGTIANAGNPVAPGGGELPNGNGGGAGGGGAGGGAGGGEVPNGDNGIPNNNDVDPVGGGAVGAQQFG